MSYAKPIHFDPRPDVPLLILSCSACKFPAEGRARMADIYAGPIWGDVRRSGFPMENVAAISALHGFLEPGSQIETYDRKMDEKIAARISGTGDHAFRLARLVRATPQTLVVGGGSYRQLAETAVRVWPDIAPKVAYALGSYLAQRKALNLWLDANNSPGAIDRPVNMA